MTIKELQWEYRWWKDGTWEEGTWERGTDIKGQVHLDSPDKW